MRPEPGEPRRGREPLTLRFWLQGFFQVYGTLFQYLAAEEDSHSGGKGRDYPTFGTSTTPWSLPARSETQVCVSSHLTSEMIG